MLRRSASALYLNTPDAANGTVPEVELAANVVIGIDENAIITAIKLARTLLNVFFIYIPPYNLAMNYAYNPY